jgi:hypothetical protein
MPFPLVVVALVESERWSCRHWLPQVRVRLRAALFRDGVAVRPEELNEFFRPLLPCVVLRGLALAPVEALLL